MQKTLIKAVLAATLFTTGLITTAKQPMVHADVNHTVHLYHFKKVGSHYVVKKKYPEMIFKNLKHTGKAITYHGTKYYYNPLYQGYLASDKYHLSFKKHAHKHATNNDTNTDNNNHDSNTGTNNTSNNQDNQNSDQIVDGFDETTSTVVDQNAYINKLKQVALTEINNLRNKAGLSTLTETDTLDQIASNRAIKTFQIPNGASNNDVHYNNNGQLYAAIDAVNKGLFNSEQEAQQNMLENVSEGTGSSIDGGGFYNPTDEAHDLVQNWLDEASANGGHYQTMMYPTMTKIGIGFYIGNQNGARTDVRYVEDYSK